MKKIPTTVSDKNYWPRNWGNPNFKNRIIHETIEPSFKKTGIDMILIYYIHAANGKLKIPGEPINADKKE